jgi:hypothetical protein
VGCGARYVQISINHKLKLRLTRAVGSDSVPFKQGGRLDNWFDNARGWWCKFKYIPKQPYEDWSDKTSQTTAGKADRPALKADTLAEATTGIQN